MKNIIYGVILSIALVLAGCGSPVTEETRGIKTLKDNYSVNETVSVNVQMALSGNEDWVGIYRKNDDNSWGNVIKWNWVTQNGIVKLTRGEGLLPAGEYEVRLFFNNSYDDEATYGFTVSGDVKDYGEIGEYENVDRKEYFDNQENKNYVVYKPRDIDNNIKMPIILFIGNRYSEGSVVIDDSYLVRHEGLMRFIATHGYYVIGNLKRPRYHNADDMGKNIYKKAIEQAQIDGENIDISSLGVIGHSLGGSLTLRVMKYMRDEGYGNKHRLIIPLDGWFSFDMNKEALTKFDSDSLFILYGGFDGVTSEDDSNFSTDPRITLSISKLLKNQNTKKGFITVQDNTHLFSYGHLENILQHKEFLRPLMSSLDDRVKGIDTGNTFFNHDVYIQNFTKISNTIKDISKYTFKCNADDDAGNDINYCEDYK